jgi:hypothetical protein
MSTGTDKAAAKAAALLFIFCCKRFTALTLHDACTKLHTGRLRQMRNCSINTIKTKSLAPSASTKKSRYHQ